MAADHTSNYLRDLMIVLSGRQWGITSLFLPYPLLKKKLHLTQYEKSFFIRVAQTKISILPEDVTGDLNYTF